jgi:hypothetical protein
MTWAEFQIRLFAYKRKDLYEWRKLRELLWITYISPNQDPKKMAKRKEQLLPLDGDRKTNGSVSIEQREAFLREFKKYQDKISKQ